MIGRLHAERVSPGADRFGVAARLRSALVLLGADGTEASRAALAVIEVLAGSTATVEIEVSVEAAAVTVALAPVERKVAFGALQYAPGGAAKEGALHLRFTLPEAPDEAKQEAARTAIVRVPSPLAARDAAYEAAKALVAEREADLARLGTELEETNRGVVALYAELDEKAEALRGVSEAKSRFVSSVSHEVKTPINSVLSLSRLLLERADGPLTPEQEKQVGFIRKSAEALSELVGELLDLSRIEAGRIEVKPSPFTATELFGGLRGTLRPLVSSDAVTLTFDAPPSLRLVTDEAKLSQILRNLVSNALKFTVEGEVTVRAEEGPGGTAIFRVRDTGIGIAPEDHARIFEDFEQVDSPLQRGARGTGLGLSLTKRLAELLGGTVEVDSALGQGATFTVTIPQRYGERGMSAQPVEVPPLDPQRRPVLVVEDDPQTVFLYEKYLGPEGYQVIAARTLPEARRLLERFTPEVILLDVLLEGDSSWSFLAELRAQPATREVPVMVVTVIDHQQKARALGADDFVLKPLERTWLLDRLGRLRAHDAPKQPPPKVLVIDDDDVARYVLRRTLEDTSWQFLEAPDGRRGLQLAREAGPSVILLDLGLPDLTGFDVLDALKADPATAKIPVIVHSARTLDDAERRRLAEATTAVLPKRGLSKAEALERIRQALREGATPSAGRP